MVEWDHNLKNSLCYVLVSHNNSNETENEQKKKKQSCIKSRSINRFRILPTKPNNSGDKNRFEKVNLVGEFISLSLTSRSKHINLSLLSQCDKFLN